MVLTITDFTEQTSDVAAEDIPQDAQERINRVLKDLTQGLGEEPGSVPKGGNEILVSKNLNGRPGFDTIQNALDGTNPQNEAAGAEAGDTLRVEGGEFNEVVSVTKPDITLRSSGEEQTTIAGQVDVTATGFTIQDITIRADLGVTDNTAVLIDDGTNAVIRNNTIIAREGGLALKVKQAPSTGITDIQTNTFQSLGNESAESLVVIGSNTSGTTESLMMTDGGEPMSLETQSGQPQVSDQPSVQISGNQFVGNVTGQGAILVETESEVEVSVAENDFSETVLFDESASPVSDQSAGGTTVDILNNIAPSPIGDSGQVSLPGDGSIETKDLNADISASDVASALVSSDGSQDQENEKFFLGMYVPTVTDANRNIVTAGQRGVPFRGSSDSAIVIPEDYARHDEDFQLIGSDPYWVGAETKDYSLRIPLEIVWNSTLSEDEFGEIEAIPEAANSSGSVIPRAATPDGDEIIGIDKPRGRRSIVLAPKFEDIEGNPQSNRFRAVGLKLSVNFVGNQKLSEIAPEDPLESTQSYVTTNKSVTSVNDLLTDAATAYDNGLSIAEEVTRLPSNSVGVLRDTARLAAFTEVVKNNQDAANSELVQEATVSGLSAFKDQVSDVVNSRLAFEPTDRLTPAGPAVAFQSNPGSDSAGINISNPTFTGDNRSGGLFEANTGSLNITGGAILSTGKVDDVQGPNSTSSNQTVTNGGSDPDLEALPSISNQTNDRAVLEFDLDVPSDVTEISFRYVFGSEEYNEFTGSEFNDVFAFFVNGDNQATVPDPDDPSNRVTASINNVNHGQEAVADETNPQLFVNNDPHDGDLVTVDLQNPPGPGVGFNPNTSGAPFPVEMDGFTAPLEINAEVNPGEANRVKIATADVTDAVYDSWVLVAAGDITPDTT